MKKIYSIALLLLCGALFLTFAVGSASSDGEDDGKNDKVEVEVTKAYADSSKIFYYIEGKAKNKTNDKFSYIQVSFNVYDKEEAVIGTCWDNQNDLGAGETWKFKALCSGDAKKIKSYKYTGYSAY